MDFITNIKNSIPDYAKDIRLNLDSILARSPLDKNIMLGCALAAAFASKNKYLIAQIKQSNLLDDAYYNAALTAASLMAMNNTWYPFIEMSADNELKNMPAGLRMNAYATHGNIDRNHFEMFALSASIIGKCEFCINSHYNILKKNGINVNTLKEIGKIAAIIAAVSHIL